MKMPMLKHKRAVYAVAILALLAIIGLAVQYFVNGAT